MSDDTIEERIREVVLGGIESPTIVVADYDPAWAKRFLLEATKIRAARAVALSVEHIGSTSVPGLAAKPIVDVLLVVEDSGDEASYRPALEEAGYVLRVREPYFHEHRMFRTPEIDRYLLLRDRLREDYEDRALRPDETRSGERGLAERAAPLRDKGGHRRHHHPSCCQKISMRKLVLVSSSNRTGVTLRLRRVG